MYTNRKGEVGKGNLSKICTQKAGNGTLVSPRLQQLQVVPARDYANSCLTVDSVLWASICPYSALSEQQPFLLVFLNSWLHPLECFPSSIILHSHVWDELWRVHSLGGLCRLYFTFKVAYLLWEWQLQEGWHCVLFGAVTPEWGRAVPACTMCSMTAGRTVPGLVESSVHTREQNRPFSFIPIVLLIYGFIIQQSTASRNLCRMLLKFQGSISFTSNTCVTVSSLILSLCCKGVSVWKGMWPCF